MVLGDKIKKTKTNRQTNKQQDRQTNLPLNLIRQTDRKTNKQANQPTFGLISMVRKSLKLGCGEIRQDTQTDKQ